MATTYSINQKNINLPHGTISNGTINYSANWATASNTQFGGINSPVLTIPNGQNSVILEEKATLEVKGSVRINGQDLEDRLERIETLLHIPTRDVTLEEKYPKLKKLWEEYNKELAKYRTWDKLKDS
jgi:hypothetical protein